MSQYLNEVLEELSRFSPNARVENPVVVRGVSPATEVSITLDNVDELQELRERIESLESECNSLEDSKVELEGKLSSIDKIMNASELTQNWKLVRIQEVLDEN